MKRIIDFFESLIDDGWPYTLVIAVLWTCFGWPFYLYHALLGAN